MLTVVLSCSVLGIRRLKCRKSPLGPNLNSTQNLTVFSLHYIADIRRANSEDTQLIMCVITFDVAQLMTAILQRHTRQTDGQTDVRHEVELPAPLLAWPGVRKTNYFAQLRMTAGRKPRPHDARDELPSFIHK